MDRRRTPTNWPSNALCVRVPVWIPLVVILLTNPSPVKAFGTQHGLYRFAAPTRRQSPSRRVRWMVLSRDAESSLDRLSPETPTNELQDEQGNVHIPSSGISVSDEMEAAQKDRFVTEVVPVKDLPGVAQLVTTTTVMGSFEPVRYLVALSQPASNATHGVNDIGHAADRETVNSQQVTFAMVDIPPFSTQLATRIKSYLQLQRYVTIDAGDE
jgi:hypothetical protein